MPDVKAINKLLGTSAVTTLVGTQVKAGMIDEDAVMPAVLIAWEEEPVSGANTTTDTAFGDLVVTCLADTYNAARTLAAAVKAALHGWTDTATSPRIKSCHLETNGYMPPGEVYPGQAIGRHRFEQRYRVQTYTGA